MPEIAQTADHALRILEELGEGSPLSAPELCQRLDLNRTVVHRLLKTLAARGFVMQQDGAYRPGVTLVRLASALEADLRAIAVPRMTRLANAEGETVVLHVVDGDQAVVLEQSVASRNVVQVSHQIGSRHSLTAGASGRAILAYLPTASVTKIARKAADPEALSRSLETVRAEGFALSRDELQMGVHGVAVPLRRPDGTAYGSLAILVPTDRARDLNRYAGTLMDAAQKIDKEYGFTQPG